MSDDPFGRRNEEKTDAFGRPVDQDQPGVTSGDPLAPAPGEPPMTGGDPLAPADSLWAGRREESLAEPASGTQWLPPVAEGSDEPIVARPLDFSPSPGGFATAQAAGRAAEYPARVGAAVVDAFVRFGIILAIALPIVLATGIDASEDEDGVLTAVLIGAAVALTYAPIMMTRTGGQTVGHRATSTRIVQAADGAPVVGGAAVVREVLVKGLLIEFLAGSLLFGIPVLLNYLWPLWDERNDALHDKICGTRVVDA